MCSARNYRCILSGLVMSLPVVATLLLAKDASALTDSGTDATSEGDGSTYDSGDASDDGATFPDSATTEGDAAQGSDACTPLCACLGNPCGSDDGSTAVPPPTSAGGCNCSVGQGPLPYDSDWYYWLLPLLMVSLSANRRYRNRFR